MISSYPPSRLKDNQIIPNTGMVIVDVGMLSGLGLLPEATFPSDLVRKVESTPEKVLLYLDSVRVLRFLVTQMVRWSGAGVGYLLTHILFRGFNSRSEKGNVM